MDQHDYSLSTAKIDQQNKNLDLFSRFMQEAVRDVTLIEAIPKGANLILLPDDDPDLAALNQSMADRLVAKGEPVHLVRMAAAKPERALV